MREEIFKCDRCGKTVPIILMYQRSMFQEGPLMRARVTRKDFDLCEDCNRKLRRWLKEKPSVSTNCKEETEK